MSKYFLIFFFLLFISCSNKPKSIYICGDHKCINKAEANQLVIYCKEIGLDLIGLMCIPPANVDPNDYFEEMNKLNNSFGFVDLSMGMSSDYLIAAEHFSTYVRVGSSIFGHRS